MPSPNFNERRLPMSMIVIHYTGMVDARAALERLRDPAAEVSAHYLIAEDGQVVRLVDEDKRAWHAGKSHWRGIDDVNSASIGIELVNPGHEHGYRPFSRSEQMDALCVLMAEIVGRLRGHPRQHRRPFGHRAGAQAGSGANCSIGSGSPGSASRCRARTSFSPIRIGQTVVSCSRSSASATTSAIGRRRRSPSSAGFRPENDRRGDRRSVPRDPALAAHGRR